MKTTYISILAFIFISTTAVRAQDNQNEYSSIFNKKSDQKIIHGGYGSFGIGYTTIDNKDAIILNIKGAWVINHKIALGLAGYGFFNNLDKSNQNNTDQYLAGGYGGFYFEPILLHNSPVHLSFPVLVGGGGISTVPNNFWDYTYTFYPNDYDIFFVVEPGVELEFNMVRFFRIALGATYRLTNGVKLEYPGGGPEIALNALDGFNFYMNFKFGKF